MPSEHWINVAIKSLDDPWQNAGPIILVAVVSVISTILVGIISYISSRHMLLQAKSQSDREFQIEQISSVRNLMARIGARVSSLDGFTFMEIKETRELLIELRFALVGIKADTSILESIIDKFGEQTPTQNTKWSILFLDECKVVIDRIHKEV